MNETIEILRTHESWLMKRILGYAKDRGYAKYTSTLEEAWRLSIAGLTASLAEGARRFDCIPELGPEEDLTKDPLTSFGVVEARRHRERGISLPMFLGLMKYYRQSYCDLITEQVASEKLPRVRLFLDRCFDRIEIAFCQEWAKCDSDERVRELQKNARLIMNEKTAYLTVFESLAEPVILLDQDDLIVNMNHAAVSLVIPEPTPGALYYHPEEILRREGTNPQNSCHAFIGRKVHQVLPWIFGGETEFPSKSQLWRAQGIVANQQRCYDVKHTEMLDLSGKFTTGILNLNDVTDRENAANILRQSEEKFRTYFEHSRVGMAITSPDYGWLEVNQRLCELLRCFPKDLGSMTLETLTHPDDRHKDRERTEKMLRGEIDGYTVEKRLVCMDGGYVDTITSVRAIRRSDGTVSHCFVQVQDVSNLKQIERRLRESEQMLRLVLDNVPQRVFWKNREFKYLGCNRPFARDAHLESPQEITGKEDFDLSWKEVAHLYRRDDQEVMESGQPKLGYEEPQSRPDGSLMWLLTSKVPLRNEQGDVVGVLGTYEDITMKKSVESALRISEGRLRSLFDAITESTLLVDIKGTILDLNEAAARVAGLSREQAQGTNLSEHIPPEVAALHVPIILECYEKAEPVQFELVLHKRILSVSVYPVQDDSKRVVQFAIFAQDCTERHQAEQVRERLALELARKNKELQQLIFIASHDLRSPLVNVMGFSRELESHIQDLSKAIEATCADAVRQGSLARLLTQDVPECLSFIAASTAQMDRLLKSLLKISRLGQSVLHFENLDMRVF
ncbi:MAG TPA: PAS domain S-box protein, partial [bacterium]|nr:PAS domain S-box protein [bacterium]